MKIKNSYNMVKQHALYKPERELDKSKLIVTELHDPVIHYELKDDIEISQITCLIFSCSINDFNLLPFEVLRSCKRLMGAFTNVSRMELSSPHTINSLDLAYVDLLIDTRETNTNDAKICLELMKNIYTSSSPHIRNMYMTNAVCHDICNRIYAYIQNNGYSEFVNKFHQHFETEQSYALAVKVALGSSVIVTGSLMLAPPIGLYLLMWATLPIYFTAPGFKIGSGEVNFDDATYRLQLTKLHKDIGGTVDYQLWGNNEQSYKPAMS